MHSQLIDKTIQFLKNTTKNGVSSYDILLSSYDPKYGTWGNESLEIVEGLLGKAAKGISKETLIEEYNYFASCYGCGEIDEWDYETQWMELEMFIDEVFKAIAEENLD
jgi:hypothetical protein